MKKLTKKEMILIKDLLKHIGGDDEFNKEMASAVGMSEEEFDSIAGSIFEKMENS